MGIKKLTPTSPARRYQTYLTRDELTAGAIPEKSLLEPKKRISGRNNDGHITVRRRAVATNASIASLISSAIRTECPGALRRLNMTRIVGAYRSDHLSGCEKSYILAPSVSKLAKLS